MKTTKIFKTIAVSMFFLTVFSVYAQNINNSSAGDTGYSILHHKTVNDCINIKFSLKNDCYAVMYVIDNHTGEKSMLVDGDISKGTHGVMFKNGKNDIKTYKCILEAYDVNSGELVFTSETNINQK